jgi:hypothetical protein
MPGTEHPTGPAPNNVSRHGCQPHSLEFAYKMKPLPKDEKNTLTDKASQNDLVLWLAYKDAKAIV